MNKRERVIAAFQGKETDRTPVCMWKHVPMEYWADDERFAEYQVNNYRNMGVDFIKMSADKYYGYPSPALEDIREAKALYRVEPLGPLHPYIRGQVSRARRIVKKLNGECVSLYLVFVPLSCLRLKVGYPMMMKLIREDPEAVKYACRAIAEDQKLLVKGLIEDAEVDGIFYSVQNGEVSRFTAEEYRDWVAPSDLEVLHYANGLSQMNAIHFCAWEEEPNRLEVWRDYKAPVVSWSRYFDIMDIEEAKKHFGCTVWGGFDNRPGTFLYTAGKEEVQREAKALAAQGGKAGYILGADCSIRDELPDERIRWVAEAVQTL